MATAIGFFIVACVALVFFAKEYKKDPGFYQAISALGALLLVILLAIALVINLT